MGYGRLGKVHSGLVHSGLIWIDFVLAGRILLSVTRKGKAGWVRQCALLIVALGFNLWGKGLAGLVVW